MRNPFKRQSHHPEKPTLQERTAALKISMARLIRGQHRVDLTDQPLSASLPQGSVEDLSATTFFDPHLTRHDVGRGDPNSSGCTAAADGHAPHQERVMGRHESFDPNTVIPMPMGVIGTVMPETEPARTEAGIAAMLLGEAPGADHTPHAPSDLAEACDWHIRHVAWINTRAHTEDWDDARLNAEMDKSNAVWTRAINEPTTDAALIAAKSRMLLSELVGDHAQFPGMLEEQDDRDRLIFAVLRDMTVAGALDGAFCSSLPKDLPAAGSPEAAEAFRIACQGVDAASRLSDADMKALSIVPGGSLWTSERVQDALDGKFSRFVGPEIEAARAVPRSRLRELQILTLRRELRMAEAAQAYRIHEVFALVYGDEPDPVDEDEAPAAGEPDPIFAGIEECERLEAAETAAYAKGNDGNPTAEQEAATAALVSYADGPLAEIVPTTAAGCVALTRFILAMFRRWHCTLDKGTAQKLFGSIERSPACATLPSASSADPHLVAMVAEWQDQRRRLKDPSDAMPAGEWDALSEQHSALQIRIFLHPARTPLDMMAKVPALRDELEDATRGLSHEPRETLAGAAWIGMFEDIERLAGAAPAFDPADDVELIALGREFDAAAARVQEAEDAHEADRSDDQKRIAADEAAEPVYDLAKQIAPLPVHTLAGVRVKLRVAAFYGTCFPRGPHEDEYTGEIAIRSLYQSTPGIEIGADPYSARIVPEADATPAPEPDPIFALIEARTRTHAAFDAWEDALGDTPLTVELRAEEDAHSAAALSAYDAMISTAPTTVAGRLALLDRLRVEMDLHGMANGDPPHEGHLFWPEFFGALRGAMDNAPATPATKTVPAAIDPVSHHVDEARAALDYTTAVYTAHRQKEPDSDFPKAYHEAFDLTMDAFRHRVLPTCPTTDAGRRAVARLALDISETLDLDFEAEEANAILACIAGTATATATARARPKPMGGELDVPLQEWGAK